MLKRKFFSGILLILGAGIFILGLSISHEANQGQMEIEEAESGYRRPTLGPVRRGIRSSENASIQGRVNAAWEGVIESQMAAYFLEGIGVILFVSGIGCALFARKRRD